MSGRPGRICRVCHPDSKLRDRIKVAWSVLRGRQPKSFGTFVEYPYDELRTLHSVQLEDGSAPDWIVADPYTWNGPESTLSP